MCSPSSCDSLGLLTAKKGDAQRDAQRDFQSDFWRDAQFPLARNWEEGSGVGRGFQLEQFFCSFA